MPTLTDDSAGGSDPDVDLTASLGDLDGFIAAGRLLQNPRLARIYVYATYYGPTTVQNVIDALGIARATAYDDVERLEALNVLVRDESRRPHRLSAEPFAFVDDDEVAVSPTVLHAVALSEVDEEVEYFLNRYGVSRLVRALQVAADHYAGSLTQRMAADELDVTPAEGMAIVHALRPALAAGTEYDPFFDRLFVDNGDDLDFELDLDLDVSARTSEQADDDGNAE